jgi:hypothetical protein
MPIKIEDLKFIKGKYYYNNTLYTGECEVYDTLFGVYDIQCIIRGRHCGYNPAKFREYTTSYLRIKGRMEGITIKRWK